MNQDRYMSRIVRGALTLLLFASAAIKIGECFPCSGAEPSDTLGAASHKIGVDIGASYVAPSYWAKDNSFGAMQKVSQSYNAHLKYSFSFAPGSRLGRMYPGAYQGVGVGINAFPEYSGSPVATYLFQGAPIFQMAKGLTLDYEWNFGASFGWKKYREFDTPSNLIVGSPINAYINLGVKLHYRLTPRVGITAGLDLTHFSNGNTEYPNPGVNTIGARVGVVYSLTGDTQVRCLTDGRHLAPFSRYFSYDVVVYGAVRRKVMYVDGIAQLLPGNFGVAGININPMYNFSRFLRVGPSLDLQYDESCGLRDYWVDDTTGDMIKFYRPPFFRQVSAGLSARAEFVMPIFSINAGVGYNLLGNEDTRKLYQVLALKVHVARPLFLHIGYQLHSFSKPSNLMIGLGYTFGSR